MSAQKKGRTLLSREQGEIIKVSTITKVYVRNVLSKVEIAPLGQQEKAGHYIISRKWEITK